jgi:hypothetical protein
MGLHRWVRIRDTDPTLDNPSRGAQWRTACRDCKRERGSGMLFSTVLLGGIFVASLVVLWFAPLLGAIMVIGTVGALLVVVGPAAIDLVVRWLGR